MQNATKNTKNLIKRAIISTLLFKAFFSICFRIKNRTSFKNGLFFYLSSNL